MQGVNGMTPFEYSYFSLLFRPFSFRDQMGRLMHFQRSKISLVFILARHIILYITHVQGIPALQTRDPEIVNFIPQGMFGILFTYK